VNGSTFAVHFVASTGPMTAPLRAPTEGGGAPIPPG
jgi:hypothetical protein